METLEKGQDKIQKICDAIRKETIEPALRDAETILNDASKKRETIIKEAEKEAQGMLAIARKTIEQERGVFQSSLAQAMKQGLESLRQSIESKLFNEELESQIQQETANPKVIADLINTVIKAIEKEGIDADLSASIPKSISTGEINRLLIESVLKKLKEKSVTVGSFAGGAQVKLINRNMTIDITDAALKELLATYIRKDYRKLVFNA